MWRLISTGKGIKKFYLKLSNERWKIILKRFYNLNCLKKEII